jgi:hypothetical protein
MASGMEAMVRHSIIGLLAALLLAPGHASAAALQDQNGAGQLAAIQAVDRRVQTIGHRLAVANLGWCARTEWRHGMVLLELSDTSRNLRAEAVRLFGRDRGIGIMALAADGPAERAGLRGNDVILGFEGRTLPTGATRADREARFAALAAAFEDGNAAIDVLRGGARLTFEVRGERGCMTIFQGVSRRSRNANADGVTVNVNAGLIDYAQGDDELASVMAHEFAHNVLRHRDRLNASGRRVRSVRETEIEADRLGIYLMARAGYDPQAAVRFWSRFGPHPLNFLRSGDHPGWRDRIRSMEGEIARVRAARAAGRQAEPDFVTLPLL